MGRLPCNPWCPRRRKDTYQERGVDTLLKHEEKATIGTSFTVNACVNNTRDMTEKIRPETILEVKRQQQQTYDVTIRDPVKRRILLRLAGQHSEERNETQKLRKHQHHRHLLESRHRNCYRDDKHRRHRERSISSHRRSPEPYQSASSTRRRQEYLQSSVYGLLGCQRHRTPSPNPSRSQSPRRHT